MRGVIAAFFVVVAIVMMALVAPLALEGVGEFVLEQPSVDEQGQDTIDGLYKSIMVHIPLILLFGFGVMWPVAWYLRRQLITGVA